MRRDCDIATHLVQCDSVSAQWQLLVHHVMVVAMNCDYVVEWVTIIWDQDTPIVVAS